MNKKRLQIEQMERKLKSFQAAKKEARPSTGWVKALRVTLGMSLQQLADKLNITKQSVLEMERREEEGGITLKSLREAADALEMELVYALVPKDGSLEALIERKSGELANRVVSRTSNSMLLEDQKNSEKRLKKAIEERTMEFKNEIPKMLWD